MFHTLPRQLFIYLVPGMLLVLAVAGWYLNNLIDAQLTRYFDTSLNVKARSLVALTELDEDGVELGVYPNSLPEYFREEEPDYFHLIDDTGVTLFTSQSVNGNIKDLPNYQNTNYTGIPESLQQLSTDALSLYSFDHVLPDGRFGRWVAASYFPRVDPDDDSESSEANDASIRRVEAPGTGEPTMVNGVLITPKRVVTYVGTSRTTLDSLMTMVDLILILTGVAVASGIVLIAGFGIRRAIAPLAKLGSDISAVDEQSLNSRLTLSRPIAELDVVVDHVNSLLERLRSAFGRERQFSADVAHELRTPIAEMRNLIEVQRKFPNNKLITTSFSDDLLSSTERMQRIVEQLLSLSRADHGAVELGDNVDLIALVETQCSSYVDKLTASGRTVEFSSDVSSLYVPGSLVWPLILTNLLDNALDHSSGVGPVLVNLSVVESTFTLTISNPTTKLQQEDMPRLTDRLWTKDSARSDARHNGLGLALVSAYAKSASVDVNYSLCPESTENTSLARFEVKLSGTIDTTN